MIFAVTEPWTESRNWPVKAESIVKHGISQNLDEILFKKKEHLSGEAALALDHPCLTSQTPLTKQFKCPKRSYETPAKQATQSRAVSEHFLFVMCPVL